MSISSSRAENLRGLWDLDFSRLNVNHGSYGAAPRSVLAEQVRWRDRMESGTTYFMADELPGALRSAAGELAKFVGAEANDLVFVDNATSGIYAILASLDLKPGDEILLHSHIYGAVLKTARHVAARTGAKIVSPPLPFPHPTNEGIAAAITGGISAKTRIAILDHIASPSALIFPVTEIAKICREANVLLLVDGAHGPANVSIDLKTLGADFYVGNCHKWLMAPKGAGFLWSLPQHQSWLHPTIISHGYGSGYLAEFDWTGTRDWSASLAVPSAIAFHHELGGLTLMQSNRELAWAGAELLAAKWQSEIAAAPELFGAMTLIAAPFLGASDPDHVEAQRSRLRALGCDAPIMALDDQVYVRISAQAYNRLDDYDKLGDLVASL